MVLSNFNPIDIPYIITNVSYPMCFCHDGFWVTKMKRLKNQPTTGTVQYDDDDDDDEFIISRW